MYDCLEEYMMEELKELGFNFDKLNEDRSVREWVKFKFKHPTKEEILSEPDFFNENTIVYQNETMIYAPH